MALIAGSLGRVARGLQVSSQRCSLSSLSSTDVWHFGMVAPSVNEGVAHTHQEAASCGFPGHARHLHSQSNQPIDPTYHPHVSYRAPQDVRLCAGSSHPFHGVVVSEVEHFGLMKEMIEDAKKQRELFTAGRVTTDFASSHYNEASLGSVESDEGRRNIWTVTAPIETLLEISLT